LDKYFLYGKMKKNNKRDIMTLFRKKTADEMQDKIINTINEYRASFNEKANIESNIKSNNIKSMAAFSTMAVSSLGGAGALMAVSAGIIAGPVGGALFIGGVTIGTAALGYGLIKELANVFNEKKLETLNGSTMESKNDFDFERKMNAILFKTSDHASLTFKEMADLQYAVKNDDGMSLDKALREMNLPDTKHKKVFKENISGQMEEKLEKIMPQAAYSSRKEMLKTGLGLTVGMGGGIAAIGGISMASALVAGLGVITLTGATIWSGIRMAAEAIDNHKIKKENKNDDAELNKKAKLSF
jgi:hypothetical protein